MSNRRLLAPLDDLRLETLPKKRFSFWKIAGPGAVLVGLSIGAGEIIIWPRIVAQFGASMVWAAVVGVFLQLWINLEIGRWTIATGETVLTGYARVWRGFAPIFILLTVLGYIAPGWGRASGLALKALTVGPTGFGSDTFWTVLTFGAVAFILFGPKLIYNSVEKTIELLVAIITVGLVVVAAVVTTTSTWTDLAAGVVNVGYLHPEISVKALFSAMVFAGAGGIGNLFYTFYLRDKNIGMGARLPELRNPLRGRGETIPATGFRFDDTLENRSRFQAWWSFVKLDQTLFFWFLNTFTMMLFIVGALAVLHPLGIVPSEGSLIWDEAEILGQVWGDAGRIIFLLVGLATLFGTQLVVVDGVGRTIADILYTNFEVARRRDLSWWYLVVAGTWIFAGCAITYVMEQRGITELGFIMNSAYMGGFAMAVYVPLTLYINIRYLPVTARPGWLCTLMMLVATLVYAGFAISCIFWELTN